MQYLIDKKGRLSPMISDDKQVIYFTWPKFNVIFTYPIDLNQRCAKDTSSPHQNIVSTKIFLSRAVIHFIRF